MHVTEPALVVQNQYYIYYLKSLQLRLHYQMCLLYKYVLCVLHRNYHGLNVDPAASDLVLQHGLN